MIAVRDTIEIRAPPQQVFDWFRNLDKNYKAWHPDHVRWSFEGDLKEGTRCHYEEMLHGNIHKADAVIVKIVEGRLLEFRNLLPMSVVCPGGSFVMEQTEIGTRFTAALFFRAGRFFSIVARRRVDAIKRHMMEEGQALKRIMEQPKTESGGSR